MKALCPLLLPLLLLLLLPGFLLTACTKKPTDPYLPARPMPGAELNQEGHITRIALGSCFNAYGPDEIFAEIARQKPDVFVFMGDNVYAKNESDDPELKSLRHAYGALAESRHFASLRAETPLVVTWDDHDYGKNDMGRNFAAREYSEQIFEHVWNISDERSTRPGVWFSRFAGPTGQRVQFIVLDTRFFSTPMKKNPKPEDGKGPYMPDSASGQQMLGDMQWQWLERELRKPADLRILLSSIQIIAEGHAWESWRMMPLERQRLYSLIDATEADNLILVSGDRHFGAIYMHPGVAAYPLHELTSSSLNLPLTDFVKEPLDEPGPYRLSGPYHEANYGMIHIDWAAGKVSLQLMDKQSRPVAKQTLTLNRAG